MPIGTAIADIANNTCEIEQECRRIKSIIDECDRIKNTIEDCNNGLAEKISSITTSLASVHDAISTNTLCIDIAVNDINQSIQ